MTDSGLCYTFDRFYILACLATCPITETGLERGYFLGIPSSGYKGIIMIIIWVGAIVASLVGTLKLECAVLDKLYAWGQLFVILMSLLLSFLPLALFRFKKDPWLTPNRFKDYQYKNEEYSLEVSKLPGAGIVETKTARPWRMPSIPLPSPSFSTG